MTADRKNALAYLDRIQRNTYEAGNIPRYWLTASDAQVDDIIDELYELYGGYGLSMEEFKKTMRAMGLGSPEGDIPAYQEPSWYHVMTSMVKGIEDVLPEMNIKVIHSPIFGSLPTGRVNGMALKVPGDEHVIILLEDGLFHFANLAAKAVCGMFPLSGGKEDRTTFPTSEEDLGRAFASQPQNGARFLELLLAYVFGGHPYLAQSYLLHPEHQQLANVLMHSFELFVLGHEYGHFVCGHLSSGNTKKAMFGAESSDEIITSWQQEFEADTKGLEVTLAVMQKQGFDLAVAFLGADFFFGCVEIVERAISIARSGEIAADLASTHPPTASRREMLRKLLSHSVPKDVAQGPLRLCEIVNSILQQFWSLCEPALRKAHKDGVELAQCWR